MGVWGEDVDEFKMLLLTARFEHLSMEERTLTNQGLFTGILTKIVGRFLSKWIPRISITLMQTKKWTSTRSSNTSTSSARVLTSSVMNAVLLHTYLDSMIRSWVPVRDVIFFFTCNISHIQRTRLHVREGNLDFHLVGETVRRVNVDRTPPTTSLHW